MIWESADSQAAYYRLNVNQVELVEGDTISSVVYRSEIWDQSFAKVPNIYLSEANKPEGSYYSIELIAFDDSHEAIPGEVSELLVGGEVGTLGCHWDCVSSSYAYRIQQYETPNGYNYRLRMAYDFEDDEFNIRIPHYQYFGAADFNSYVGFASAQPQGNHYWHNLQGWEMITNLMLSSNPGNFCVDCQSCEHCLIKYEGVQEGQFVDNLGHDLPSGNVFGIRKGYGPWFIVETQMNIALNNVGNFCDGSNTLELQYVINNFNQSLNIEPTLICPPNYISGGAGMPPGTGGGGISGGNVNFLSWAFKNWGSIHDDGTEDPGGSSGEDNLDDEILIVDEEHWIELIENLFGNEEGSGQEATLIDILASSEAFVLRSFHHGPNEIINKSSDDFFDENGTPTFPTTQFDEGLYSLTVKREGYKLNYVYFEVREKFSADLSLKHFFDALMYPNPHSENIFYAGINTTAALKVQYHLYDSQGNILYNHNFEVPKDHSGNHQVDPEIYLPTGFLYHKFTFADGSFKTYTTQKH